MATSRTSKVIEQFRKAVLLHDGATMTDGELLGCFIEHREEAAFTALVRRHAPMVWGVCRRLLNHHDAEDAFQAAFLVLARKAASVVPREMLANWLYGVAHQAALHARRTVARRRARERQVAEMPEPAVADEQHSWDDLRPLLDQELSRLPDKYRAVLVLSDLEGKTRGEAARQLGLPEGTMASRLTRARAMLAKRLAQRGVALSSGALAAILSRNVASAGVPTSVLSSTIKTASFFGAGQTAATGAISAKVVALTEGVLKIMLLTKLKVVTIILLTVSFVALSTTVMAYRTMASDQDQATNDAATKTITQTAEKPKTKLTEKVNAESKTTSKSLTTAGTQEPSGKKPKDEENTTLESEKRLEGETSKKGRLYALLKERLEILKKKAERMKELRKDRAVDQLLVWQADLQVYKAELDLCETARDRIAVLEKIAKVYKDKEEHIARLVKLSEATPSAKDDARLERLEAEIALEREKATLATPRK